MRALTAGTVVLVLGLATWAGVAFASCGQQQSAQLIWENPAGSGSPSSHTYIVCTTSGKNTASLTLAASRLAAGDSCTFTATLANTGTVALTISSTVSESTPHGAPSFASCFAFTMSGGPTGGELKAGAGAGYTFTLGVVSAASSACKAITGTVDVTFTGTECNTQPQFVPVDPSS